MQKQELSLQRLTTGLRELATMKTDLSQYVAAGDSALLEQQLEQLHSQWEELCVKVRTDPPKKEENRTGAGAKRKETRGSVVGLWMERVERRD